MKVKQVTVNYGVTRNMGNYESLRLDYSATVSIDSDTELMTETLHGLRQMLRLRVAEGVKEEIEHTRQGKAAAQERNDFFKAPKIKR